MNILDKIEKVINKHSKLGEKIGALKLSDESKAKIKTLIDKALEKALDEAVNAGLKALKDA